MNGSGDKDGGPDGTDPLWDHVARTVTPLPGRDRATPLPAKRPRLPPKSKAEGTVIIHPPPTASPPKSRDLDKRTDSRVQKGRMMIEARLDLHGMTQGQAHQALTNFLWAAQERGFRHVLVVTGKGGRNKSPENPEDPPPPGILKQRVPEWLDTPPLRDLVLKHHAARPRDGGDGALYVLIRRKR